MIPSKARSAALLPYAPRDTRVLLVNDQPLMRRAIQEILEQELHLGDCAQADSESTATRLFLSSRPNLVLMDLCLGAHCGLELLKWMLRVEPATRILVMSTYDDGLYAERVIRAGARGYVNTRAPREAIIEAIRSVLAGRFHLNPAIAGSVLLHLTRSPVEDDTGDIGRLSDREMETFQSIGAGLGSREIARRLCVSVKTVEAYRERIKGKLGIATGPALARRAVEWVLSNE